MKATPTNIIAGKIALALLVLTLIACALISKCAASEPITFDYTANPRAAWLKAQELRQEVAARYPGAYVCQVTGTYSMWPAIDDGCYIVIATKPWEEVEKHWKGEVVSRASSGDCNVLHRIVDKLGNSFIMRGDNNGRCDTEYVNRTNYRGSVFAVVRFVKLPERKSMSVEVWRAGVKRGDIKVPNAFAMR